MNRSLASNKAIRKEVRAGSTAAADSRSRVSRIRSPDRVASKGRGKADKGASAKVSPSPTRTLSPALAGVFLGAKCPRRFATPALQ